MFHSFKAYITSFNISDYFIALYPERKDLAGICHVVYTVRGRTSRNVSPRVQFAADHEFVMQSKGKIHCFKNGTFVTFQK